jgi:hypothetical protein
MSEASRLVSVADLLSENGVAVGDHVRLEKFVNASFERMDYTDAIARRPLDVRAQSIAGRKLTRARPA